MTVVPTKYKRGKYKKAYKVAAKVADAAKSRYVNKGNLDLKKVSADIAMLKLLMNVEKKRFDIINNSSPLAQLNGNAAGNFFLDCTPIPTQGVNVNQRTGASLKVVSGCHKFQFWTQSANNHKTRLRMEYFFIKGASQNVGTFLADYYSVNQATGLIDYNSLKNPDYYGQARCFYKKEVVIPAPQFSGETMITDILNKFKLNHHVRFDQNSITVDDGQIILIIRADSGNYGTISTVGNVPIQTAASGLLVNSDIKWYYVDN